ncbi:MAG: V-type ATP synthase subunit D [Chlamydiales bacterium]|nr:V-type ATP synthase subunit D [Chlamydiales bacterium]MCH9619162.1 V-type ATP synthase subunit D [Chlamydiales bacterium]MCH9622424.1 V-type ATP synthase subunit D [Chlamydiales bacterium]
MEQVKLTKNALRGEQIKLTQLERYLPTLQLKKAMLQTEVNDARLEIGKLEHIFHEKRLAISSCGNLLSSHFGIDLTQAAEIERIDKRYENVAGVDIPIFEKVVFKPLGYALFSTPPWLDGALSLLQKMVESKAAVMIGEEKLIALEKELREVSIRVNLFEKNLIPKALQNIKRIKVFLGDQELAAVGQAKVAKNKIEMKRVHAH